MKFPLCLLILLISLFAISAQNPANLSGHFEAYFNAATNTFSYQPTGEITKDGVEIIDLKIEAIDSLLIKTPTFPGITEAAGKEKESLNQLRHRLLVQRERMIKPLPPMEEVK